MCYCVHMYIVKRFRYPGGHIYVHVHIDIHDIEVTESTALRSHLSVEEGLGSCYICCMGWLSDSFFLQKRCR